MTFRFLTILPVAALALLACDKKKEEGSAPADGKKLVIVEKRDPDLFKLKTAPDDLAEFVTPKQVLVATTDAMAAAMIQAGSASTVEEAKAAAEQMKTSSETLAALAAKLETMEVPDRDVRRAFEKDTMNWMLNAKEDIDRREFKGEDQAEIARIVKEAKAEYQKKGLELRPVFDRYFTYLTDPPKPEEAKPDEAKAQTEEVSPEANEVAPEASVPEEPAPEPETPEGAVPAT